MTHVWWGETVGRERTSLMLLQLVSSPICYVIVVICTHTSDPRLMRRDCRQGKDLFIVVATCVQSHLLCYFSNIYNYIWLTFDKGRLLAGKGRLKCCYNLCSVPFVMLICDIYTYKWLTFDEKRLERERTSLMLLQLVSSPICTDFFVIFKQRSDSRLMRRDCRHWKDVFNVVTTCVQSHLLCYFCYMYTCKWPTFDEGRL